MPSTGKWKSAFCMTISLITEECSRTVPSLLALIRLPFITRKHFVCFAVILKLFNI